MKKIVCDESIVVIWETEATPPKPDIDDDDDDDEN